MTPFETVTHADPYPYYAGLRRQSGLFFDADLRLWIASDAQFVEAILGHPDCRVRPISEPVPAAIAQGAAGMMFGRLMRMNECAGHLCPRSAIEPALAAIETRNIAEVVARVVETLDNPVDNLDELMFTLPVCVMAAVTGVPFSQLKEVAKRTRDFVGCLSPLSDEVQLGTAHRGGDPAKRNIHHAVWQRRAKKPLLERYLEPVRSRCLGRSRCVDRQPYWPVVTDLRGHRWLDRPYPHSASA